MGLGSEVARVLGLNGSYEVGDSALDRDRGAVDLATECRQNDVFGRWNKVQVRRLVWEGDGGAEGADH